MDAPFDEQDVQSVMRGLFDINATLGEIRHELRLIRRLLEDSDEEEEEEEDS